MHRDAILDALADGPLDAQHLSQALSTSPEVLENDLETLVRDGRIRAQHLQTLPPRTLYRTAAH